MTEQIRTVETADDLLALRADTEFHEGALAVLTYPTASPVGYIGWDNPKSMFGRAVVPMPGFQVVKGEAGDFETRIAPGTYPE